MTRHQVLKEIFENVNKWLTFAETKNAALAAFNSGVSFSLLNLLKSNGCTMNIFIKMYISLSAITCIVAALFCLFSFMPATRIKFHFIKNNSRTDNIYFYEHIARHDVESYLQIISTKMNLKYEKCDSDADIANQIISNSKIAFKKYWFFKKALWLTISGVASPLIALTLFFVTDPEKH